MFGFQAPYRAAVIGHTGRGDYGHNLDLAMKDQPKLKLVAVADEDAKGRAAAARRLGVERAYLDYREMLDNEKPQFVAVAPRWVDRHKEMILACVERGIHVLAEKPLAPDLGQADAIVSACERAHVKLAIAFQTRYSPRYERAKELIGAGAIGEVLEIRGRGKEDHRGGGEDWMVLGPHLVDMARDLLGAPSWCFARVTERGAPITRASIRQGAEGLGPLAGDRIDAVYGFAKTPATFHLATARPREGATRRFGLWVFGSLGVIELRTGWLPPCYFLPSADWTGAEKGIAWKPISSLGLDKPEPLTDAGLNAANRLIVADLIRSVETDTQPRASLYDARSALEMLLACHTSHAKGSAVTFPLAERTKHPLETL
jgi:predicted dehydrogenase